MTLLHPSLDEVKQALSKDFFRGNDNNNLNNNGSSLLPAAVVVLDHGQNVEQHQRDSLFRHFSRLSLNGGSSLKHSVFGSIGSWMSLLCRNSHQQQQHQTSDPNTSSFLKSPPSSQDHDWTQFCKDVLTSVVLASGQQQQQQQQSPSTVEKENIDFISVRLPKVAPVLLGLRDKTSLPSIEHEHMSLMLDWLSSRSASCRDTKSSNENDAAQGNHLDNDDRKFIKLASVGDAIVAALLVILGWTVHENKDTKLSVVQCSFCGACQNLDQESFEFSSKNTTKVEETENGENDSTTDDGAETKTASQSPSLTEFFASLQKLHHLGLCNHTFSLLSSSSGIVAAATAKPPLPSISINNNSFESSLKSFTSSPSAKYLSTATSTTRRQRDGNVSQETQENNNNNNNNNSINDDQFRSLRHAREYFQLFGDFVFHIQKLISPAETGNGAEFELRLNILASQRDAFRDYVRGLYYCSSSSNRHPLKNAIDFALSKKWIANGIVAKSWKDACGLTVFPGANNFLNPLPNVSTPSIFDPSPQCSESMTTKLEKKSGVIRKREDQDNDNGVDDDQEEKKTEEKDQEEGESTISNQNNTIKRLASLYANARKIILEESFGEDETDESQFESKMNEAVHQVEEFIGTHSKSQQEQYMYKNLDTKMLFPVLQASLTAAPLLLSSPHGEGNAKNSNDDDDIHSTEEDSASNQQQQQQQKFKMVDQMFQQAKAFLLKCPPSQGLCPYDITADCPHHGDENSNCFFKHVPCKNGNACKRSDCFFGHTKERIAERFVTSTGLVNNNISGTNPATATSTTPVLPPSAVNLANKKPPLNLVPPPPPPSIKPGGVTANPFGVANNTSATTTWPAKPQQQGILGVPLLSSNNSINSQQQRISNGMMGGGVLEAPLFAPPLLSGGGGNNNNNSGGGGGILDADAVLPSPRGINRHSGGGGLLDGNNQQQSQRGGRGGRGSVGRGGRGANY